MIFLQYLMQYLKSLYDWLDTSVTSEIPLARHAWALLLDSYFDVDLTLHTPPDLLTVSIIYLILKVFNVDVPSNDTSEVPWWKVFSK